MSTELLEQVAHPPALNAAASKIRFAWALPACELVLCAILLWPARMWILYQLGIHLPSWLERMIGVRYGLFPISHDFSLGAAAALNVPGMEIQLPYAIFFSPDKREWMPRVMDFRVWRAITWPFLCLPFWWIAGRAMDALIAIKNGKFTPRIGWTETIIGFLLMTTCAIGFAGLLFGALKDKDSVLIRFAAGCGLWAMLGGLSVIAWFRQRRLRKKTL